MLDTKAQIARSLEKLLALPLSIARDAADMKNFQFGAIRPHPSGTGTIGQYALHIQCPWRITTSDGIVTGSTDFYEPAEEDKEVDLQNPKTGNLQRKRLGDILRSYDASTRSWVNGTGRLVVQSVRVDEFGGFELELSGDARLQIFPCGSRGEDWRFFEPGSEEGHMVVAGGRVSEIPPQEVRGAGPLEQ